MIRDNDYARYMIMNRPQASGCFWCACKMPQRAETFSDEITSGRVPVTGVAGCKPSRPHTVPRSVACDSCRNAYSDSEAVFYSDGWGLNGWNLRLNTDE
ncbi:hypothetical protein EXIGLDRAFT_722433 [Exidia glandulosa HHB12029]|uniref:Uncharacterized protein n=1 Tax=Exidia glandulosa HHB12029 TaxID=1314781 RepID=A0A165FB73_EXIGL|nr:hypothetical protein EXIGLDRAFT_722433 [Exidia glandulosa HHB12029]